MARARVPVGTCAAAGLAALAAGCNVLSGVGNLHFDENPEAAAPAGDAGDATPGPDGAPWDAPASDVLAPATRIVSITTVDIRGVTADGYVVYYDLNPASQNYNFVPVDGSRQPQAIATVPPGQYGTAAVDGKTVFAWAYDPSTYVGTMTDWTLQRGATQITTSGVVGYGALSADESALVYVESTGTGLGTIYGSASDGTHKTALAQDVQLSSTPPCNLQLEIVADHAFAAFCSAGDGAQPSASTVTAFSLSDWSATTVTTDSVGSIWVDSKATEVLVTTAEQQLKVFPVSGGAGLVVDPADQFTPSGFAVQSTTQPPFAIFSTSTGRLGRSALPTSANPTPPVTTLLESGVHYWLSMSPDQQWIVIGDSLTGQFLADLSLASTATSHVSASLGTQAPFAQLGAPFTSDSQYVLFDTSLVTTPTGATVGKLVAAPVGIAKGTGTLRPVSAGLSYSDLALGGTKVLFLDNFNTESSTADIDVIDLASAAAPTLVATGADRRVAVTADFSRTVYAIPNDGIYVRDLP